MRAIFRAVIVVGVLALSAIPAHAEMLLDNGSQANWLGRPVSGGNFFQGLTTYQPFSVVDEAWHVTSIGVDGWVVRDTLGLGMLGTLLPDDGFGNPMDNSPIADAVYHLGTDPFSSNWQDEVFDEILMQGDYWMRWSSNGDPDYIAGIFDGVTGDNPFTKQECTGVTLNGPNPTALRIMGNVVPGPTVLTLMAIGLFTTRRRR